MKLATNNGQRIMFALVLILLSAILITSFNAEAQPSGVSIVYNTTEIPTPAPADSITTAGGSFTTLILNGTFQNPRWKAYVGNVSGILTLDNSNNYTIYNWDLASISGEVYVTRNDSTINWNSITCASNSTIGTEETYYGMNYTKEDSINRTFNNTIHKGLYVGTILIGNSTCRSIATYVNDSKQAPSEAATFQEILLQDSNNNILYTTILENSIQGYDNGNYDFQMIVPDTENPSTDVTYYFYAEIS